MIPDRVTLEELLSNGAGLTGVLPIVNSRLPPPMKPEECRPCSLYSLGGATWSRPEGRCTNGVMLVGEALGEHEQLDGLPFRPQAQAGSVLEQAIRISGLSREQFVLWNIVGCRPPYNKLAGAPYERNAIGSCQVHFDRVVEQFQPKVMVAMGNIPISALTGLSGPKLGSTAIHGYALDSPRYGIPVVACMHPSYLGRGNRGLLGVFRKALLYALKIAQSGLVRPKFDYKIFPSREVVEEFIRECGRNPRMPIWIDIETEQSLIEIDESVIGEKDKTKHTSVDKITQIQYTFHPGTSIVTPWGYPWDSLCQRIMLLPNPKEGWNWWDFDLPHLREAGMIANGPQWDTMYKWHFWEPDLPRGLQFASSYFIKGIEPWKHLSHSEPGLYGANDSNYNSLVSIAVEEKLKSRGLLATYGRHVRDMHTIHIRVAERGLPINKVKLDLFGAKLDLEKKRLDYEMQLLHPLELRNIHPENGYVREPESTEGMIRHSFIAQVEEQVPCLSCEGRGMVMVVKELKKGPTEREVKCPKCKGKTTIKGDKVMKSVERWCQILPFKTSNDQLIRYIKFKKYRVPTVRDKHTNEWKETTGKDELAQLFRQTKDPLLKATLSYREVDKLKGTYVDGWQPSINGRLDTWLPRYTPATGQLAAVEPNVLTLPKRGKLGKEFREVIEAPAGRVLVELDYKGFHAATLGLDAHCPEYIRLASLDIHSFITGHGLKLTQFGNRDKWIELPDEELKEILDRIKAEYGEQRDGKFKPVVHGIGFGEGAEKIFQKNMDTIESRAEAQKIKDLVKGLFGRIFGYQQEQVDTAHQQKFLISKWNYIRWFWDAKHYDPKRRAVVNGEEAESAMAFRPANHAHGMFKEVQIRTERKGWNERFQLILPPHDALIFCPLEKEWEEAINLVAKEMMQPCMQLADPEICPNGFVVGVDAKWGRNLKEMKEYKL